MSQLSLFNVAPCIEGIDSGKLQASYSADTIGTTGTVRSPVAWNMGLWVCTSKSGIADRIRCEAYELVDPADFVGETYTYSQKSGYWREGDEYPGDFARADPNGFYHGMRVKRGGANYVLRGPEQVVESVDAIEAADLAVEDACEYCGWGVDLDGDCKQRCEGWMASAESEDEDE